MSDLYHQLLDATIAHLQARKAGGEQYISVAPETWAALVSLSTPTGNFAAGSQKAKPAPPVPATAANRPVSRQPTLSPAPAAPVSAPSGGVPAPVEEAMGELRRRTMDCQKCPHLARTRKSVVFGVGNVRAELMFVGEAPGADEDEQGEPFVGKAGHLLTRIIQAMDFTRDTVYIANVLKCRPDTPGKVSGNRKPTPEEMQTCLPYLLAQIELIKPKVIVALGGTAVEGLLGKAIPITRFRGRFADFHGIPLMPTYHPSYLLRNPALSVKREVWEDMLQVLEKLGRPISEKQRNYFLKG